MIDGFETVATVADVTADVEIDDGGAITIRTDDREAVLRARTPGVEPLSRAQTALMLAVSDDDATVTVELDHDQRDALLEAIGDSQEGDRDE